MRTPRQIYEEHLVLAAQSGDGRAFDRLVRHAQPSLLRHALHLVGPDGALDAVQEGGRG